MLLDFPGTPTSKARQQHRADPGERSPVFFQFLDCVHQLMRQFPTAFEYTEDFLLELHAHTMSGLYGTFLHNNEKARVLGAAECKTASVWPALLSTGHEARARFVNQDYAQGTCARLRPRTGPAHLALWEAHFTRWLRNPSQGSSSATVAEPFPSAGSVRF